MNERMILMSKIARTVARCVPLAAMLAAFLLAPNASHAALPATAVVSLRPSDAQGNPVGDIGYFIATAAPGSTKVAVNLSARSLHNPGVEAMIVRLLVFWRVDPSCLEL
jgi:hypothetical protein